MKASTRWAGVPATKVASALSIVLSGVGKKLKAMCLPAIRPTASSSMPTIALSTVKGSRTA